MDFDITRVSHDDGGAIEAWCDVVRRVRDHDLPLWRDTTHRMTELFLGVPFADQQVEGYLAWRDGVPVGRLILEFPTLENLDNIRFDLYVVPAERRRGAGRAMHDFAQARAAELGRKRFLSSTLWDLPGIPAPNLDGARFAEALGYAGALPEVVRRLDLTTLDEGALAAMHAAAQSKADGYRIATWVSPHPEELIDDLAYLDGRLSTDAPLGELKVEPSVVDADRIRRTDAAGALRGRTAYHAGAVHDATGRLVAWTTISKDESLSWHAFQQITIVDPEHRGHRLGALVKVANLMRFREAQPGVRAIDTFNAAENSYMISINEQMGFRPLYAFQYWQREI